MSRSQSGYLPPHNGNPINMMKFSPKGKYLVTYSEDDETFVVWNVENIEKIIESKKIIDLNNPSPEIQEIKLYLDFKAMRVKNFCVYSIYSISKLNRSLCRKIYKMPKEAEINPEDIRISYDQDYTCLKMNEMNDEKIFIHSDKLSSMVSFDLNDGQNLKIYMKNHRYSLFDHSWIWNSDTKRFDIDSENYRFVNVDDNLYSSQLKTNDDDYERINLSELSREQRKILKDCQLDKAFTKDLIERLTKIKEETDHKIWKNKIEKLMKKLAIRIDKIENLAEDSSNFQIMIAKGKLYIKEDLLQLLGSDKSSSDKDKYLRDANKYLRDGINFSKDIDNKDEGDEGIEIIARKSLNNNNIVMLTEIGIFIFHLIDDKIFLRYYHNMYKSIKLIEKIHEIHKSYSIVDRQVLDVKENDEEISKYVFALLTFAIEEHDTELISDIYNYVNGDKEYFLRYGPELLISAIKLQDSNLIDTIYNECLDLFKKDLENNNAFLSIINKSMPLLHKYYPEYITRYSSDTNMIIDSPKYKIEQLSTSHLYSFSNIGIVNLTPSIAWTKYTSLFNIIILTRYFHANVDETRKVIQKQTKVEYSINKFSDLKENLQKI
ncbi:13084_t:CDS:2 [Funneliformis geosporum]|uniref:13084_t:CDS:1 n=1 Tax=Funneliformis geosporum TaxID=1117311 RepID=A0A9W4SJT0_9GLOM|nr:13084_t:CDS:2 [Funneliformis geosporum]